MSKILEVIEEIGSIKPHLIAAQHRASLAVSEIGVNAAQDNLNDVIDEHCARLDELSFEAYIEIQEAEGTEQSIDTLLMNFNFIGSVPLRLGSEVTFELDSGADMEYRVITPEAPDRLVWREGFFSHFVIVILEAENISRQAVQPELEPLEICMPLLDRTMEPEDRFIPFSRINIDSIQHGVWVPLTPHLNPAVSDIWKS